MTQWHQQSPIYLQLQEELANAILEKRLAEGDLLPSIRQLSADYQLNPQTISKAYQGLVDEGVVIKQRGIGMIVAEGASETLMTKQKNDFLNHQWPKIAKKIQQLGLSIEELL
jgi:GntR family transcriptional regulator